jgi:hypothetical protein
MIFTPHQMLFGRSCDMYWGSTYRTLMGNPERRSKLEDLDVSGKIILK